MKIIECDNFSTLNDIFNVTFIPIPPSLPKLFKWPANICKLIGDIYVTWNNSMAKCYQTNICTKPNILIFHFYEQQLYTLRHFPNANMASGCDEKLDENRFYILRKHCMRGFLDNGFRIFSDFFGFHPDRGYKISHHSSQPELIFVKKDVKIWRLNFKWFNTTQRKLE